MASGFLKSLSEVTQGLPPIKRLLHDNMGAYRARRDHKTVHASDLTNEDREFCPREFALLDLQGPAAKPQQEYVNTSLRYTFETGEWVQSQINNVWLRDHMIGDWECRTCGKVAEWTICPSPKCNRPGVRCNWQYRERRFPDPDTGVSCGVDGFVNTGAPKLRILESKILDKDYWKKLVAPQAEHRIRTRLYMKLIAGYSDGLAQMVDTSRASVLYVARAFGQKDPELDGHHETFSPFKEYTVERDDSEVEEPLAKARVLQAFRSSDRDPARMPAGVCPSIGCPRAQQCPVAKQCFSGQFPARVTWTVAGEKAHDDLDALDP